MIYTILFTLFCPALLTFQILVDNIEVEDFLWRHQIRMDLIHQMQTKVREQT